jgi:hypothetical protein
MAKTQTFGDKNKKKGDTRVNVKVIKAFRSDRGTMRFTEKFVMVNDAAEIDKIKL